jgi:hypothetical protein
MAKPKKESGESLETQLSKAVDEAIGRVIKATGPENAKGYENLKAPILGKLVTMANDQAFELTFNAPEVATAFAAGFNEKAPRTNEYVYGAIADGSILSLKRMAPIGFIIKDGKQVPI